jgi:Response regulator receiver domain
MAALAWMRCMSKHILVVEDDDQIAAIVRDGLSRMGYRVELAADGPAALAAVRAQPLDLVVLDLSAPPSRSYCDRLECRARVAPHRRERRLACYQDVRLPWTSRPISTFMSDLAPRPSPCGATRASPWGTGAWPRNCSS